ncbi:cytochrome P450 [Exophiala viscosa]|uniref:cytochrome P450 n=1 Tax=Exophiala viscosa TaxID=2486360 RepID=UPI00218E95A4|nr:cytochrome P450 [Exophiala viscosa]
MLSIYSILLLLGLFVVAIVRKRWFHPLSKFPGPFLASQTDLWRVYHLWTRRMPENLIKLHEKYGPVVRYGPNDLSFHGVAAINPIYKSGRKVSRSNFYDGFTTFHPNLFGMRDEELHAKRRRQMAHSFSVASLSQMESIFHRRINHLVDVIDSYGPRPFDLKELLAYYTYDLMGELIFNAEFGSMAAQDPDNLPPINEHIFLGCMYGMLPSLLPYSMQLAPHIPLPWLQDLLKSRKTLRDQTAKHVAEEFAKEKSEERHNILARLMEARDPETGEELTEAQISSEAFAFLVAGSHTTSGTLTLLFYHLLHNSVSAKNLTEELNTSLQLPATGNKPLPAYSRLEMQLPYATACIRENYRVTPVFTMPLPRAIIEPGGTVIDGHHVPQGANVAIVNEVLQHNASAWGEDHDNFRPERWLDSDNKLSPNDLLPFGAGHRACIGRNIASMSVLKVLTTLWRRYELEAVDPAEELIVETVGIGEKKGSLMVRAKLRPQ